MCFTYIFKPFYHVEHLDYFSIKWSIWLMYKFNCFLFCFKVLCDAGEFLDFTMYGSGSGSGYGAFTGVASYGSGVCTACPRDTYQPDNATDTPSCLQCPPEAPRNLINGSTSASDCVYGLLIQKFKNVHLLIDNVIFV